MLSSWSVHLIPNSNCKKIGQTDWIYVTFFYYDNITIRSQQSSVEWQFIYFETRKKTFEDHFEVLRKFSPPHLESLIRTFNMQKCKCLFQNSKKKKFSLLRDFQLLGNIYFLFGSRKRQMELKTLGVDLVTPLYTHFMLDPPTHFLSKFVNVNDFVIIMLCTAACDNTIWNASSTSSLMGLLLSCNKQDAPTN